MIIVSDVGSGEDKVMGCKKIILVLCILLQPYSVCAKDLKLIANIWSPYVSDQMPNNGLAIDIVTTAFSKAGYKPTFKLDSWPRALEGGKLGIYDVVAAIWYTEERARDLEFSKPYLVNEIKFIKRKNQNIEFNRIEDLRGLVIGVVKDYAYDERFISHNDIIKIPQNHVVQNLLSLVKGDIDLTLGDQRTILYELNQYMQGSIEQLEFLPKPLAERGLRIAASKENPKHRAIVADFNRLLENMKSDGSYKKIFSRHGF